jgi:uncharacterized protein (UPF0371 family)
MRERGRYQIQLMKTRSSSGVGQKIDLEFNIDSLRISDCEQEDSYGNSGTQSAGSSLLASIKNRATVDATTGEIDPNSLTPIAKVKANVESSKLRELLNNLPGDDLV